jgi:hypothetical protein
MEFSHGVFGKVGAKSKDNLRERSQTKYLVVCRVHFELLMANIISIINSKRKEGAELTSSCGDSDEKVAGRRSRYRLVCDGDAASGKTFGYNGAHHLDVRSSR